MAVEYRVLGPLEALVDGRPAKLGGPRQRGILAALVMQANTLVLTGRLIDELWPDEPPASAANLLQGYVSGLRKALGKESIETRGAGYLLRAAPDAVDLERFERLAHAGSLALEQGRLGEAASTLAEALALWRGPALADLADEPFLQPTASRLDELRVLALERRLEADVGLGRHADVVTDQRRDEDGAQCVRRGRRSNAGWRECGILPQDRRLELAEPLTRLDAELLDERAPRLAVRLERLGLASRSVEREHQEPSGPLAERVLGGQELELG